jgi:hypothetical protein
MADLIQARKAQSLSEIRQWDFDFSADLVTGVTVASATATHIPPSGVATTPSVGTIAGAVVPVKLGPLTVTGQHYLSCLATLSDGEKSELRVLIRVDY